MQAGSTASHSAERRGPLLTTLPRTLHSIPASRRSELVQRGTRFPALLRGLHLSSPLRAFRRARRSSRQGALRRTRPSRGRRRRALRESPPQGGPKKRSKNAMQRCHQQRDYLVLARSSCQYANVSAGPVSLAGSSHSRTRPTKNKSPANTPAIGRKRSNRSETTQFLSRVPRPYRYPPEWSKKLAPRSAGPVVAGESRPSKFRLLCRKQLRVHGHICPA